MGGGTRRQSPPASPSPPPPSSTTILPTTQTQPSSAPCHPLGDFFYTDCGGGLFPILTFLLLFFSLSLPILSNAVARNYFDLPLTACLWSPYLPLAGQLSREEMSWRGLFQAVRQGRGQTLNQKAMEVLGAIQHRSILPQRRLAWYSLATQAGKAALSVSLAPFPPALNLRSLSLLFPFFSFLVVFHNALICA